MADGVKYRTEFTDILGVDWKVDIHEDAYTGAITDLTATGEPLYIEWYGSDDPYNQNICGSRASVIVWSDTDFQLTELFTSDRMEFPVKIYNGSNLITSWSNDGTNPYETFTSSGVDITSAINSSGNGLGISSSFTVTNGEKIYVKFFYTKNSGTSPVVGIINSGWTKDDTSAIVAGWNEIELIPTWTGTAYFVFWNSGTNVNYSVDDFFGYRESQLYWRGFIIADNYSEPYSGPPYPVTLQCNDGLGILKDYDFSDLGYTERETMAKYVYDILGTVGITSFKEFVNTYEVSMDDTSADSPLDQTNIHPDAFEDMNQYETLSGILKVFNAFIRQNNGQMEIIHIDEIKDASINGRLFTSATAKSSITKAPAQNLDRTGDASNFADTEGGSLIILPAVKKIKATQDFGNRESWIRNWDLKGDTFNRGANTFDEWTAYNNCTARLVSYKVPGEVDGMLLTDHDDYPDTYAYQSFGADAVLSVTDVYAFEFDYLLWNDGTDDTDIDLWISVKSDSTNNYLKNTSGNEWLSWDSSTSYIHLIVDSPNGSTGWATFQGKVLGLPAEGSYTIKLFTMATALTDIYVAYKNIRFYTYADGVSNSYIVQIFRRKYDVGDAVSGLTRYWSNPWWKTEQLNIRGKQYTQTNANNGTLKEYNYFLGDISESNSDDLLGVENIVEQFKGCLTKRVIDTYSQPKIRGLTKNVAPVNADVTVNGVTDTIVWTGTAAGSVTAWVGTAPDFDGSVVVTDMGSGHFHMEAYNDFTLSYNPSLFTEGSNPEAVQELGDPIYAFIPSEYWPTYPLVKTTAIELKTQQATPRQVLDIPVYENSPDDYISINGNFTDDLNGTNIFIISKANLNVRDRQWNLTLTQIL